MKFLPLASMILSLFFSTTAISADLPLLIDRQMAANEERIGTVSISGMPGSSDDAVKELQKKAAAAGGSKLRIISLGTPGKSSMWMGNAEVYR